MSYKDYQVSLTIKAILLFEKLSGHSFMAMQETDMVMFLYAVFITSNSVFLTYNGFMFMMEDNKFSEWLSKKVESILEYVKQFNKEQSIVEEQKAKQEPIMLTQVVGYLAAHGVDYDYIINQMQLWEIDGLLAAIQEKQKEELEFQRMWTYINISPLIDSKKVNNPQALIMFPWEKEQKNKKAEEDLKAKQEAIKAFFKAQEERNKQKEQEQNAKDK